MHIGNRIYEAASALIRFLVCKLYMLVFLGIINVFMLSSLRFLFVKSSVSTQCQHSYKKDAFILKCILAPQVMPIMI